MAATLRDRIRGCLLGLAIGDALGARFRGKSPPLIRACFPTISTLVNDPVNELRYSAATQMTLAVAEQLLACGEVRPERLVAAFAECHDACSGHGRDVREAVAAGVGPQAAARAAAVGLYFHGDEGRVWEQARRCALPGQAHTLGVEGAQLLALAVSLAATTEAFDREAFLGRLLARCTSPEYRDKLEQGRKVRRRDHLEPLGSGQSALEAVPAAIASFAYKPESYADAVGNVLYLGGQTDALGAMAGALAGAYLGAQALPSRLVSLLENSPKGRNYIVNLAGKLNDVIVQEAQPAAAPPKAPARTVGVG